MPTVRICEISDEDFGGFSIAIDLDYYYDLNEIADYVKNMLVRSLQRLNLHCMVGKAKNKHFHIHDKKFSTLRQMGDNEILYVCGHC